MTSPDERPARGWSYMARTPEGVTLGHCRWQTDAEAVTWVGPMTRNPARSVIVERYAPATDTWTFVAKVRPPLSGF